MPADRRFAERSAELRRGLEQAEARIGDLCRQLQGTSRDDRNLNEIVTHIKEERVVQQRQRVPAWRRAK
jgi:hypothetical protein